MIEEGNQESSGSDDMPSEDNMDVEEICQLVPAVDKKLKNALKKVKSYERRKQKEREEEEAQRLKMLEKARKIAE